jgi:asparagine N-glycosylation enzyme membrane subunit Stt3
MAAVRVAIKPKETNNMPYTLILAVLALVLFVLDGFTVSSRWNLTSFGLACFALIFILARGVT